MDPANSNKPTSDLRRLLTGVSALALVLAISAVMVGTPIFGGGKPSEKIKEAKEEKQEKGAKGEEKGGGEEKKEEKKDEGEEKLKDQNKKKDEDAVQPAPAPATSPTITTTQITTTTPAPATTTAPTEASAPTSTSTIAPTAEPTPTTAPTPAPTTAEPTPAITTSQPEATIEGTTTPTTTETVAVAPEPTGGTRWWDATPPGLPSNMRVVAGPVAVTLRWLDPPDGDLATIDILRNIPPSTAVSGIPLTRVPRGEQQYVDAAVVPATTYVYILRAQDGSGNVRLSDAVAVMTPATPIFRVTGDEQADSRTPAASSIIRLLYGVDWPDQLEALAAFIRRAAQ